MNALRLFATVLLLVAGTGHSSAASPDVLVFLVDDLGVMDTELRDSFYESPNVRRLAERGMRFTNGYCAHPRCVPSRYALQTGRLPCRDAMNSGSPEKAMEPHKTIAEAFGANGYATFFAGKWHLGKVESDWPHRRGYQTNIGGCHAGAPGSYFFPFHVDRRKNEPGKYGPLFGLANGEKDEHLSERLTSETLAWIRSQTANDDRKPFFAFLSHYAVHTPIEGKPDEVAYFEKKRDKQAAPAGPAYRPVDGQTKAHRDDPRYASMIKTMDESLGAILDGLDALGLTKNTIIVLTSDHGGLSNRGAESKRGIATSNLPYRAGKGHLYEGGLRVPFLVAYPPAVAAGSTSASVALGTDLYPTLLDLAGLSLDPKSHADGISLAPALGGKSQKRPKPLIWHSPLPRPDQTGDVAASAIRVGNRKLIKKYFPLTFELYDLAADPHEQANLAADRPEDVAKLRHRLEAFLTRHNAMAPRKDWKDKTVTAPLTQP